MVLPAFVVRAALAGLLLPSTALAGNSLPPWLDPFPSGFWPFPFPDPFNSTNSSTPIPVGQPVNTTSGLVSGHPAPNASLVSEYLSIPYALPPTGARRFQPPARYYGSSDLPGTSNGIICPQAASLLSGGGINASSIPAGFPLFLTTLGGLGQTQDEDCLTVNVWTKRNSTADAKKPVMVWIYGGGFATGNSNASAYSGQYWADQEDVVFVNFNYRLGILGFSGAPNMTQNVGLLDQRMALEWVRDNIAAFGGDTSRIILFGESAGAASTDYYSYAWTADPIIAGTISESGQVNSFGNKDPSVQASRWYTASTAVGCGNLTTSTASAIFSCMQSVDTQRLITSSAGTSTFSLILSQFGPTIDEVTVFSNYTARALSGSFIPVPSLLGSNDNEAGIFIFIFNLFGAGIGQPQAAWDTITELVFTCPANSAAYARYINNVPVWRYRYFPSFPNIQLNTSVGRAYHLSEVFPLFGTDEDISHEAATLAEVDIGGYMRSAWASFAHDPKGGLAAGGRFGWPQYSPDLNTTDGLVLLGYDNETMAQFVPRGRYDPAKCTLFYEGLPGL